MADHVVPAVDETGLTLISEQWQDLHCLSTTSTSTQAVSQEPMQSHEQPVSKAFGSSQRCLPPDPTRLYL